MTCFSDWAVSSCGFKAVAGAGVRARVAGIPVKVDWGVSRDGEVVRCAGLGGDFRL